MLPGLLLRTGCRLGRRRTAGRRPDAVAQWRCVAPRGRAAWGRDRTSGLACRHPVAAAERLGGQATFFRMVSEQECGEGTAESYLPKGPRQSGRSTRGPSPRSRSLPPGVAVTKPGVSGHTIWGAAGGGA